MYRDEEEMKASRIVKKLQNQTWFKSQRGGKELTPRKDLPSRVQEENLKSRKDSWQTWQIKQPQDVGGLHDVRKEGGVQSEAERECQDTDCQEMENGSGTRKRQKQMEAVRKQRTI